MIIETLGMTINTKSNITTPGAKIEEHDSDIPLDPQKSHLYRSLVARANFVSLDKADIQSATKELSRFMQSPTERSWQALLRLAKFLKMKPRYVQMFELQRPTGYLNIYVDSDWAGEGSTRKSTSWGSSMLG